MKINLIILGGLLLIGLGWVILTNQQDPQFANEGRQGTIDSFAENGDKQEQEAAKRLIAPNFDFTTISGEAGSLIEHQGKVILLHFWASWCAPCIIEFPDLLALAEKQKENLIVLAISTDQNSDDIEKFLKKIKINIPSNVLIIQDGYKAISQDLYQTIKLPETYVIDTQQGIVEKIIGPEEDWLSEKWVNKINSLAAKAQ